MAANLLFFYMHVNYSSLPHFRLKILWYFAHADEAKRANLHGYKKIIKWLPFLTKVYTVVNHIENQIRKISVMQELMFYNNIACA